MKALCFQSFGGPEVLKYLDVTEPQIHPTDIIVRTKAIGLNFADIYRRNGNYHIESVPPYILGYEGAGVVESVGSQIQDIKPGDRVAFTDVPFANAELVSVPYERAIPLPSDITFEIATSLLLQGLTAQYLTQDSFSVCEGQDVVIHASAGGVGQLLIQFSKLRGAKVIGLTSSEEKRQVALAQGADHVLLYTDDWDKQVRNLTKQSGGADVVYDSVGTTLRKSLDAVKIGGTVVFFGMAGGNPEFIDPLIMMETSKTLTGGDLWNVLTSRSERIRRSNDLFELIRKGRLMMTKPTVFPLAEGAEAHRLLQSRTSTGKILLVP